jgi:hypothetical protein
VNWYYCANFKTTKKTNKYIKFAETTGGTNLDGAAIMCVNSQTQFGYSSGASGDNGEIICPGTKNLYVYQCDNFQCQKPILIGKDSVTFFENNTVDHGTNTFTLDSTYGEDCTPMKS